MPALVAAAGLPDEDPPAESQDVAAVERARRLDEGYAPMVREHGRDVRSLGPPRFRPGSRDNRDLVEDNGHVFDEDGVGQIVEGGQRLDAAARARQRLLVRAVLRPRAREVDGLRARRASTRRRRCRR